MTTRTAAQQAVSLLQSAYGITYTEREAGDFVIALAERIIAERKRPRHNLTPEQLDNMARRYNDGESLRSLAKEAGYKDAKSLAKKLRPVVEAIGGEWRTQKASQAPRRAMEALTKEDVRDWGSHELFRNGK